MPPSLVDGLPLRQRYWAVLTVGLAITMSVLDGAIANVALPTIAHDLHASPTSSIWVVNAYQLVVTVTLLPLAALGEILEFRRIYWVGLVLFTFASLACALSSSLGTLVLARAFQGLAASGIMSVNTALIRFIYPRRILGRGIGINAVIVSLAAAAGPTVAAAILAVGPWQWLFLINVPIGIVALLAAPSLPASPRARHRFDYPGALMSAFSIGLLIVAIDGVGHQEPVAAIGGGFAAAILIGTIVVWRESHQPWPLLPVDLLRIRIFALSVATSLCSFVAQMLAYVALPFYLQNGLGMTQVETGLLMTPWPLATAVMAPISGRLSDRYPAGALGGLGLAIFAAGLALLALLPAHATASAIAWRMAICGAGFGIFQSPNNRAIIASAPPQRSGGASGMLGTARLMGQTIGTTLVALMFGLSAGHGSALGLALAAVIAAAAAGVSCVRLFDHADHGTSTAARFPSGRRQP